MFRFVANLKPYTLDPQSRRSYFASYLVSVDYASALRALVQRVHEERRIFAADNGNFDRIGTLIKRLAPSAFPLAEALKREEAVLGHSARPGDLSTTLGTLYKTFSKQVAVEAKAARREDQVEAVVVAQMALSPSYVIGMEDFTTPLLIGLNIERAYAQLPVSFFTMAAERAIDYAVKTRAGAFGPCNAQVFAGLHAIDFDTARAIGKQAGLANVDGIAAGMGSALDDRNFIDYRVENGKVLSLGQSVPRPYVRALEIAAGLHLGFADATGRRPRFHALGAGTPILLPLLAVLGDRGTYTATDSTAPIKDAYSSATISLYIHRPAPLKLKAHVIVERWLDGGLPWDCSCPHCTAFLRRHPFKLGKAKDWWVTEGRRALTSTDMWAPSPLAETVPLLAMPKNPTLRKTAGLARVAHNHWTIRCLESAAGRRSRSESELRDWAEKLVEEYMQAGSGAAWKAATRAAWTIASSAAKELEEAGPGGEVTPKRLR
jgi:hypothetical protein